MELADNLRCELPQVIVSGRPSEFFLSHETLACLLPLRVQGITVTGFTSL